MSDGNNSKLNKIFFALHHFVVPLLIFVAPRRFPSFICQVKNISAEKNLPKWARPWGNSTYDLRLLTHLRPTINATRLLSHLRFGVLELVLEVCCPLIRRHVLKEEKKYYLRFQRLNSNGNFFERYYYNVP